MNDLLFPTVGIAGIGLIGGSLAKDLRTFGLAGRILGWNRTPAHAERALELGLIDEALPTLPDHALVDGLPVKGLPIPHDALVKGDSRSLLIACASILAKVSRDRLCLTLDAQFPGYGLAQHKGYGTRAHLDALRRLGPSPCHRRSFAPVRALQDDLPFPD